MPKKESGKDRIKQLLLSNVGQVVTAAQLRDAAHPVSEWARRVRELREEEGWPIITQNDRADLKSGEYILTAMPAERDGIRFQRSISQKLRAEVLDRHRLFESSVLTHQPHHRKHDRSLQVAGSYGGARRDKREAREVRKGGYVPTADVQRRLLGTPWMTEKGCQLSIPPAYSEYVGNQLIKHLAEAAA